MLKYHECPYSIELYAYLAREICIVGVGGKISNGIQNLVISILDSCRRDRLWS
jgi:hypothetical protein